MTKLKVKNRYAIRNIKKRLENELRIFMIDSCLDMVKMTRETIEDYYDGTLERFPGDYDKRIEDYINKGRNMPLIDTQAMYNGLDYVIVKNNGSIQGFVTTDVEYFEKLDKGDNSIIAYNITSIAHDKVIDKIIYRFNKF